MRARRGPIGPERLSRLSGIVGCGATVLVWACLALMVWSLRESAWTDAVNRSHTLLRSVERTLDRDLELYDLSLTAVCERLNDATFMAASPAVRALTLFDRSVQARGFGSILVMDPDGDAILDSGSAPPRRLNGRDRLYFQVHRAGDVGLFIGRPWKTRLSGREMIPLSRRLSRADGAFAGVVVGAIEMTYFEEVFRRINRDPSLGISVLFADGSHTDAAGAFVPFTGLSDLTAAEIAMMDGLESGAVDSRGADGVSRYNAFMRVGSRPIKVSVSISHAAVGAHWKPQAAFLAVIAGGVTTAVAGLLVLLRGEFARRIGAEAELVRLAHTDALTGIPNRRSFDLALGAAVGRGERAVALMLVDVDRFKSYNDTYGHLAGDDALRQVARAIDEIVGRSGGTAFRIGGEEFAAVLPAGPEGRPAAVAAEVRDRVERRAVAHRPGIGGVVTVSVGLADGGAHPMPSASRAVAMADDALYRAKSLGRNRVEVFDPDASGAARRSA